MKKMAIALSAALALALAAPAFAAVDIGGKIGSQFELKRDSGEWVVEGKTGLELETGLTAGGGNPVKAVVKLKPWKLSYGFNKDGEVTGGFGANLESDPLTFKVDKAWIETEGAYWHDGPSVATRIGDIHVAWNDYVGHLEDTEGVTVQGMRVGPALAKAFYAWDGVHRPMGLAAEANISGLDLDGIVVRRGTENNMAFAAGMDVLPGIRLQGDVALDGDNRHLFRVQASADGLIDGVRLSAAYRGADDAFNPMYTVDPVDEDDDPVGRNDRDNVTYDLLDGFSLAAETTMGGVRMAARYDDPHKELNLAAGANVQGFEVAGETTLVDSAVEETKVSVKRGMTVAGMDVAGEYRAKIVPGADMEHALKAKTTTDMIPQLRGLGLSGEVKLVGKDISWNAAADYKAPNGLNLGAEYDSVDGPSAVAGVTVEF